MWPELRKSASPPPVAVVVVFVASVWLALLLLVLEVGEPVGGLGELSSVG